MQDIAIIGLGVAIILNAINVSLILKRLDSLEFGQAWIMHKTELVKQLEAEVRAFEEDE